MKTTFYKHCTLALFCNFAIIINKLTNLNTYILDSKIRAMKASKITEQLKQAKFGRFYIIFDFIFKGTTSRDF